MLNLWLKLKDNKIFRACVAGLVLLCIGYFIGNNQTPNVKVVERTIEDTSSKQKLEENRKIVKLLQEQLQVTESKLTEAQSHVKTVVRIVKQKDGTTIIDKVTESDSKHRIAEDSSSSKTSNEAKTIDSNKKSDSEMLSHKDTTKVTTPTVKPWFVGPIVTFVPTAPVGQQFIAGVVFGRYLGTVPLLNIPVSAAVSVAVPTYKPISVPSIGVAITAGF